MELKNKKENLQNKLFVNFFDTIKYRAIIYNNRGEQLAIIPINRNEKSFKWKNRRFLLDFNHDTSFNRKNIFSKFKYFIYNINHSSPISFKDIKNPKFDTEALNLLLETKVLVDLNTPKNKIPDWLNFKTLMIIAVIGGIAYYLIGGH